MIWKVPPIAAKDRLLFILAGGPSLRGFDARVLKNKGFIVAINDSWRLAPFADLLYFCDQKWWQDQIATCPWSLDMTRSFHDMIYHGFWVAGNYRFADHPQVRSLQLSHQLGLETNPERLCHGSNSGYQAINLAYHLGAKTIVLLGYDMRVVNAPGDTGVRTRMHWHDAPRPDNFENIMKNSMLPCFDALVEPLKAAGVEVINATPDSALKCWPHVPLDKLIGEAAREGSHPTPSSPVAASPERA